MNKKLSILIKELSARDMDFFLISTADEFLLEYVPERNMRLKWLTNFSGSNAIALISKTKKIFFTDGRYILQAKKQIDKSYIIFDLNETGVIPWIEQNLQRKKILLDTKTFSKNFVQRLFEISKKAKNKIIHDKSNLVDKIWKNRPEEKIAKFFQLQKKFTGLGISKKLDELTKKLKQFDFFLISSPESVCWLLNLRGFDLPFTPIILIRAIVSKKKVKVFVDKRKLPFENFKFNDSRIDIFCISEFEDELKRINNKNFLLDSELSYFYFNLLKKKNQIKFGTDPCKIMKSQKNNSEKDHSRLAHLNDGIALVKFFCWLEKQNLKENLNEFQVAKKLEELRQLNKNFFSLSFPTISASGSNASIIHYTPNKKSNKLSSGALYLCDSGAQYYGATTDVTRTVLLGKAKATDEYINLYSKVLLGHVNISMLKFPVGTKGSQIDVLGRYNLWNSGLDYNHGTGHGVGSFLGVHEGPQNISKNWSNFDLKPGMIISNEPGYYKNNQFGIRIENLLIVEKSKNNGFLEFETLTLCPYEKKLINKEFFNKEQICWINNYHKNIFKRLSKYLNRVEANWLKNKTSKI